MHSYKMSLWNIAKGTSVLIVITIALYGLKGEKRESPPQTMSESSLPKPNWGDGWGHDL